MTVGKKRGKDFLTASWGAGGGGERDVSHLGWLEKEIRIIDLTGETKSDYLGD